MHKLIRLYSDGTSSDITPLFGEIQWRSNKDELGVQLDVKEAIPNDSLKEYILNLGDLMCLINDKEIWRGVVITKETDGKTYSFTCMDYAFYLNKNKEVYQFDTAASDAITQICRDFNIPIGNITEIPTNIKHIYTGELSETIKDILDTAEKDQGIKYIFEMREGKFYVEEREENIIKATTNLFGTEEDLTKFVANPSRKLSIENMKNSIKIVQGGEEDVQILAVEQDQALIDKFGMLQEVQSIDENDIAKVKNIAENTLKDLGKISEECTIELIGHDDVRAGRILEITEEVTGMNGKYLIKDCTHTIANGIHKMQVGLELV